MRWDKIKMNDIIIENPKSKIKVEESNNGEIPFFTSGENILKSNNELVNGENIFLSTGGFASIKYFNGKASYSTDTYSLKTKCNTLWLYYLILSKLKRIDQIMFQGSGLRHLNKNMFKNMEILLPSDKEQQKIAEILSTVDEAIEKVEDKIKTTERIKKGLMDKLFIEKELVPINELFHVINGKTPSTKNKRYWDKSEINWFTPVDLKDNSILLKESLRKISKIALNETSIKLLPKKSIIFSCRAPVGLVAVMEEEGSFNQGCKGLIPLKKENINPYYYAYYISLNKQKLINKAGQSTFKEISTTLFETFEVPNLPIEKQNKTVNILSSIDELIESQKVEKDRLGRIKQGLMDDLLTGRVRVKV